MSVGQRAHLHLIRDHPDRALRVVKRYNRLRPGDARSWQLLAMVQGAAQDPSGSRVTLQRGVRRHQTFLPLRVALVIDGLTMRDAQDLDDRWVELKAIAEKSPDSALVSGAFVFLAVARKDWKQATLYSQKANAQTDMHDWDECRSLYALAGLMPMIPGAAQVGREIVSRCQRVYPNESKLLIALYFLNRESDPEAAERTLQEARRQWTGSNDAFQEEVQSTEGAIEVAARYLHNNSSEPASSSR